jgi:lipoate-protein ligase A
MALDHALTRCLGPNEGVVRLYGWSAPTVSFGKNERGFRVRGVDVDYVRRSTGGRAVLHDQEVTYAVVAPVDAFGGLRDAYRRINEALADALRALGAVVALAGERAGEGNTGGPNRVEARESGQRGTPGLDAGACFRTPVRGEVVAEGRKLVGSAQARMGGALLQHGSILLGGDQRVLEARRAEPTSITLRELLGDVSREQVAEAAAEAFGSCFGGAWLEAEYAAAELDLASRLEAERYGRDTWTWRR